MSSSKPSEADNSDTISADAAAVITRARRSFAFSIGLLMLGFIAVALALVYRSGRDEGNLGDKYAAGVLVVPSGAAVISAVPSEGMIAIAYELDGKTRLRLVHGTTGALIRDIDFATD